MAKNIWRIHLTSLDLVMNNILLFILFKKRTYRFTYLLLIEVMHVKQIEI